MRGAAAARVEIVRLAARVSDSDSVAPGGGTISGNAARMRRQPDPPFFRAHLLHAAVPEGSLRPTKGQTTVLSPDRARALS